MHIQILIHPIFPLLHTLSFEFPNLSCNLSPLHSSVDVPILSFSQEYGGMFLDESLCHFILRPDSGPPFFTEENWWTQNLQSKI